MKDLAGRSLKSSVHYGMLIGFSALVNNQFSRMQSLQDIFVRLEESATGHLVRYFASPGFALGLFQLLGGVCLLMLLSKMIKRRGKRRQALKLMEKAQKDQNIAKKHPSEILSTFYYIAIFVIPLIASGLLFASCGIFGSIYSWFAGIATNRLLSIGVVSSVSSVAVAIKIVVGLFGIYFAILVYGFVSLTKHGPILRRIEVDGYAWITEKFSWTNWVIGRKVKFIPWIGKAGVHLPSWATNTDPNESINVQVNARDFTDGSNKATTYISYFTDREPVYGDLGPHKRFERNILIADGESRTLVRQAFLEESEPRTRLKTTKAFGDDIESVEGKCLFCCRFNIKRGDSSGDEDSSSDSGGGDSSLAANSFEQWDKMGFRRLFDWGDGYKVIYRSHAFDIDMDYFASAPLFKGAVVRRLYHVRDADNRIVARLQERNILKKMWPLKDNDWRIDIFDPELAGDTSFGYVLSLITQYLRKRHLYCLNASQKMFEGPSADSVVKRESLEDYPAAIGQGSSDDQLGYPEGSTQVEAEENACGTGNLDSSDQDDTGQGADITEDDEILGDGQEPKEK